MFRKLGVLLLAVASLAGVGCSSSSAPRLSGPAAISVVTPGPVSVPLGMPVSPLPVFVVLDSSNRGLPNITVAFTATGGSQVTPLTAVTDEKGRVSPNSWVMPGRSGTAFLIATIPATGLTASISTAVGAGPPASFAGRPFGVAYLGGPSPEFLVTELDVEQLAVLNASSYASLATVPTSATPTDIAINAQGTLAYVTGEDGPNITVVGLPAGTLQRTFSEPGSVRLLLSPDGSRLYVGKTGGFDVLSTASGAVLAGLSTGGQINGMAMSPDGSTLWLSNDFTGKVYRVNAATGTVTDSAAVTGTPQEVAYHAPSGTLYVANEGGWVDVLDGTHLGTVRRIGNVPGAFGMRLTADGTKLVVAGSLYGSVYVVDRATGVLTKTVTVNGTPRRTALLPDGRVAVANEGGYITLVTP